MGSSDDETPPGQRQCHLRLRNPGRRPPRPPRGRPHCRTSRSSREICCSRPRADGHSTRAVPVKSLALQADAGAVVAVASVTTAAMPVFPAGTAGTPADAQRPGEDIGRIGEPRGDWECDLIGGQLLGQGRIDVDIDHRLHGNFGFGANFTSVVPSTSVATRDEAPTRAMAPMVLAEPWAPELEEGINSAKAASSAPRHASSKEVISSWWERGLMGTYDIRPIAGASTPTGEARLAGAGRSTSSGRDDIILIQSKPRGLRRNERVQGAVRVRVSHR